MKKETSFLAQAEKECFQIPGRHIPRRISPDQNEREAVASGNIRELAPYVMERIRSQVKSGAKWFECLCVVVKKDDGMSWSAEAVSSSLGDKLPNFNRWNITRRANEAQLPLIANYVGVKRFLKGAIKNKLTTSFLLLRSWLTWTIVGLGIILGAAGKVLELYQKSISSNLDSQQLIRPGKIWIIAGLMALFGLAGQYIASEITTRKRSRSIENFIKELDAKYETESFDIFINKLAEQLCDLDFPRIVIIDGWQDLDKTTKKVIEAYFNKYSGQASGSEFWVVFEDEGGDCLSGKALLNLDGYGYARTQRYYQIYLDEKEKRQLISIQGRPERAIDFVAAKSICFGNEESEKRLIDYFSEYRRNHPHRTDAYGHLEFLFFLSLASSPGDYGFVNATIIEYLPERSKLRSRVLIKFLPGTMLSPNEFKSRMESLKTEFGPVLQVSKQGGDECIRILAEASHVLMDKADMLLLPNPNLGHLYWALFWYDREQNKKEYEAFWLRKLAYHLIRSDIAVMEQFEDSQEISSQLCEALIFTIKGCMRTCIFENLTQLIDKAFNIIRSFNPPRAWQMLVRLLKQSWEAYSILGDECILSNLAENYLILSPPDRKDNSKWSNTFQKIFFEAISLPQAVRSRIGAEIFFGQSDRTRKESFQRYAESLSICFIYTLAERLEDLEIPIISRSIQEGESALWQLIEESAQYLYDTYDKRPSIIDAIALSNSLWAASMRFGKSVITLRQKKRDHSPKTIESEENALNRVSSQIDSDRLTFSLEELESILELYKIQLKDFSDLVDLSLNAVLAAEKLSSAESSYRVSLMHSDILFAGLSKEIYISAISALNVAYAQLPPLINSLISDEIKRKIDDIFKYSNEFFGSSFTLYGNDLNLGSSLLTEKIKSLLELSIKIWDRFGIKSVANLSRCRYLFYVFQCLDVPLHDFSVIDPLIVSLSPALNQVGFIGLVSNLLVADCLKSAIELSGHFANVALAVTDKGGFGKELNRILASLVLRRYSNISVDAKIITKNVAAEEDGKTPYLLDLLKAQPETGIIGFILSILCYSNDYNENIIMSIVNTYRNSLEAGTLKEEIGLLIEIFKISREGIGKRFESEEDILTKWESKKDSWLYPWVLEVLIKSGYASGRVLDEGIEQLDHDAVLDSSNTYLFLGVVLGEHLINKKCDDRGKYIVVNYLKNAVKIWDGKIRIEKTIEIYQLLIMLDKDGAPLYEKTIYNWLKIKLYRDYQRLIPEMFERAAHFLMFEDYYRCMRIWGLESDLSISELRDHLNEVTERKIEIVHNWKASGAIVASPFIDRQGKRLISGEFLYLGHYLFSPPFNNDTTYDLERNMFNSISRRNLPALLETILSLKGIPESLAELLSWHAKRFDEFTGIEE